jgi:GTP-binding protein LepA
LEREFNLELVATAPSVIYQLELRDGSSKSVDNPAFWPGAARIAKVSEPYVRATIITPSSYVGTCIDLCKERRGDYVDMEYTSIDRVVVTYDLPLAEILMDFFDSLKSRSKGYASFDYELLGYRENQLSKIDILINGEPVDALSFIAHSDKAYSKGKALAERLKEVLPRQLFEIRIQAAMGSKVIAAERILPLRKHVTAKCYGGDVTRKRKLLEKQKEGKRRLKSVGRVEIPQEAFLSVLKVGSD